jgi:serine/threonine protein kinase
VSSVFCKRIAGLGGVRYETSVVTVNPSAEDELTPSPSTKSTTAIGGGAASPPPEDKRGFFARMFGSAKKDVGVVDGSSSRELTINDFDLLKVVGKGAFGKVMLVRKKAGTGEGSGNVYAMKVLKKSVIAAKGQIEHTKSERAILCEVTHPFIVHLRFAFQNSEKLYLVTDYYNSGTLFYHLRKALKFPEARAKFYACELLSALEHLHSQNIIYRDLKLENILMSHNGHIALTDFGLSKQNVDASGGATTFCGTAEYLAPGICTICCILSSFFNSYYTLRTELLKNLPYGPSVDFWSFGILVYEMLEGKTPFFDKNRKVYNNKILIDRIVDFQLFLHDFV